MKKFCQIIRACLGLTVIHLALQSGQILHASVITFTNTPAAISNTYNGTLTLQIGGLTNGETVVIQKFLDANTNGIVDASDLLIQQFKLTDGSASVLTNGATAVTNFNVPGDLDGSANGQITAQLYPSFDFLQIIPGKYLFVVSSPTSHFSPQTNSFSVTNFPFAQSFTGNVVNGGTNVPNAIVFLLPNQGNSGNPQFGAVANNSGAYTIKAPPGTYQLLAFKSNYVANGAAAPSVTLGSGATTNINATLTNATVSISGKLVDASNTNNGLGGMSLFAQTGHNVGGLIASAFTDTNGNFTLQVTPNQWRIAPNGGAPALKGYVASQNKLQVDTTGGSTNGVTIPLSKVTAIFYGTVKDNFGNPLPGATAIYSSDNNGNYQTDGFTDANGNYVAGAVGGLGGDQWQVSEDYSSLTNYILSQGQNSITLSVGQAYHYNFTALLATNYITGNVKNSNNTPIVGVNVSANATISNVTYQVNNVTTDTNGNYSMQVANGSWSVSVNCNGGSSSLDGILGNGNYQCPNSQNVNIANNNGVANFTVQPPAVSTYQIFGYVTDGIGNPIIGVTVHANGSSSLSTTTDSQGYYVFTVATGSWTISVDCSGLSSQGYSCVSDQMANISNSSTELDFAASTCQSLAISTTTLPNLDAGFSNNITLYNVGCNPPYSWSMTPGSLALPSGLSLSSDGTISGTPATNTVGTNYFSIRVTDAQTNTADQFFSLVIYPTPRITNSVMPAGILGVAYNVQLGATGGSGSFFGWNLVTGSFPPGLGMNLGGDITGSPTQTGTFSFTVGAEDNEGSFIQKSLSITIGSPQITSSLTNGITGVAYSSQLQVVGGTPPYTWTIANGSQPLPSALSLSTGGLISGIPGTNGTFSFIVRETDSNAVSVTKSLSLTITAPAKPTLSAPVWVTNRLQLRLTGVAGQNYTIQYSTNLASTNWTQLFITNNGATNSFIVTDPHATNSRGFYRALVGP